jgi:hypothetical protein
MLQSLSFYIYNLFYRFLAKVINYINGIYHLCLKYPVFYETTSEIHIPFCDKCAVETNSLFRHLTRDELVKINLRRISGITGVAMYYIRRATGLMDFTA